MIFKTKTYIILAVFLSLSLSSFLNAADNDKKKKTQAIQINPSSGGIKKPEDNKTLPPETSPAKKDDNKSESKDDKLKEKQAEADKKRADIIEQTIKFGTFREIKDSIIQIKTIKNDARRNEIIKLLIPIIEDPDTDYTVLIKICYEAENLKMTEGIPSFVKLLKHNSEDVRIAAVNALKSLKAKDKRNDVVEIFKAQDLSKDSNFITSLLDTMASFEVNNEFQYIKEKIEDKETSKSNKLALIKFLGDSKTLDAKDILKKYYVDPEEDLTIRSYSVNALAKIGAKDATPDINKVIEEIDSYPFEKKKKYNSLYSYSITALSKLGDDKVYERLQKSMKSDNAGVRLQAINLLKDLKDQRAIDILKYKAEYDENPKVQFAAREALKELGVVLEDNNENQQKKPGKKKPPQNKANGPESDKNKQDEKGIGNDKGN